MQRTHTLANKPTHASHKCGRTNATIEIKTVAWTPSQESRLEQLHVINYTPEIWMQRWNGDENTDLLI